MQEDSRGAVVAALLGNLGLATLKGVAAAVTGSAAMLAETLHSLADTGNQVLLFVGMRLARRPPDAAHPFGHGTNVYFWAFVVSGMLFTLGGGFAIWEAVRSWLHPAPHGHTGWAFAVLGGAAVFESASLAIAVRALQRDRGGRPLRDYVRDSRDPTLLTVVCEDSAAIVSVAIAAAGLWLSGATGDLRWDALASGTIGIVLVAVAVFLAFENYSLLIGEPAAAGVEQRIRRIVARDPAVAGVASLHTLHLGPESLLVALGLQFRGELSGPDVARAVARLQQAIHLALDPVTQPHLILIEPVAGEARPAQAGGAPV
jgi:cation diffusion facilitator family transporter